MADISPHGRTTMTTKLCKYCASEIPVQAAQCSVCKNYQKAWRNNLLFVAGLAGFISLIAGAFSFSANQVAQLYKSLFWRDHLNVLEFQTGKSPEFRIVLSNSGDGPVFASSITVYWQRGS